MQFSSIFNLRKPQTILVLDDILKVPLSSSPAAGPPVTQAAAAIPGLSPGTLPPQGLGTGCALGLQRSPEACAEPGAFTPFSPLLRTTFSVNSVFPGDSTRDPPPPTAFNAPLPALVLLMIVGCCCLTFSFRLYGLPHSA